MGKYIVELEDGEHLYKTIINALGNPVMRSAEKVPYTEPDLEQIRKEAYEQGQKDLRESCVPKDEEAYGIGYNEGFQCGLDLAWDAARKLYEIDWDVLCNLFGKVSVRSEVLDMFTASEVLQKLRTYEQEQKEKKKTDYYFEMMKDAIETSAKEYGMSLDEVAAVIDKMRKPACGS